MCYHLYQLLTPRTNSYTYNRSTNTILPSCLMLNLPFFFFFFFPEDGDFVHRNRSEILKIQNHLVGYNKSLLSDIILNEERGNRPAIDEQKLLSPRERGPSPQKQLQKDRTERTSCKNTVPSYNACNGKNTSAKDHTVKYRVAQVAHGRGATHAWSCKIHKPKSYDHIGSQISKLYEAQQEKHIIIISIRTENSVNKDIDVVTV